MSTWTNWEYKRLLGNKSPKGDNDEFTEILDVTDIPKAVDWR